MAATAPGHSFPAQSSQKEQAFHLYGQAAALRVTRMGEQTISAVCWLLNPSLKSGASSKCFCWIRRNGWVLDGGGGRRVGWGVEEATNVHYGWGCPTL